jgi:glycosyltransferase involved in cell wall biosynthesis
MILIHREYIKDKDIKISLLVPVFNEKDAIPHFIDAINAQAFAYDFEFLFINDGSIDGSLDILLEEAEKDARIRIIDFTRNFGKEAALTAGIFEARGDIAIPLDVDLQDPLELIPEMISKWREVWDVVCARRVNRDSDSPFKRLTSQWFYAVHNYISELQLPSNVGDFRLIDKVVLEAIKKLPESRRFMKGIFAWVGFSTTYVDYVRPRRIAGKSKFNGWKLFNFAIEGITSFSIMPLKIWTYVGILISIPSIFYAIFILIKVFISGIDLPGYASLMVAITFLGGVQLIGIGVLGEYIGRAYLESKNRPIYLIRKIYES